MAECKKMMQLCEESLDRTLTPDEQNMLDRHLKECPACAAYLADLRFLSDALGETPELPAGLHDPQPGTRPPDAGCGDADCRGGLRCAGALRCAGRPDE